MITSEEPGLQEYIIQLSKADENNQLQLYHLITIKLTDVLVNSWGELKQDEVQSLYTEILSELDKGNKELCRTLLNLTLLLLKEENSRRFLLDDSILAGLKFVIRLITSAEVENILVSCFEILKNTLALVELPRDVIEDLLKKLDDILTNKSRSTIVFTNASSYISRFVKHYEKQLLNFLPATCRLLFLPLNCNSSLVRETAEKTLLSSPDLLNYSENEAASMTLLKILKEPYCKEFLQLFKEKEELYVLRIWTYIVKALGKTIHGHLPSLTPFFQIIERGFKSLNEDVSCAGFNAWKQLITNFSMNLDVLNDSKKLRFILKPFKNVTKLSEKNALAVCESWWHLARSLARNLSLRFTEVCIPLLEFTLGKSAGLKSSGQSVLMKKGIHILLRLLEQPQNLSVAKISSPKKMPTISFPMLEVPLDSKVIVRHFKEIIAVVKPVIETCGNSKEISGDIEALMKSLVFVVCTVIEEKNKDSLEAVETFYTFLVTCVESKLCPAITCLKCIGAFSKLNKSVLVSHGFFNNGYRKPQELFCLSLLKLLFNPYIIQILDAQSTKRFIGAYTRIVETSVDDNMTSLQTAQKVLQLLKTVPQSNVDILLSAWTLLTTVLHDKIEKTKEVNQGDRLEHDFSCLYDVLSFPFEHSFPPLGKATLRLWTSLYKGFVCYASLIDSYNSNEAPEQFCLRLKASCKESNIKDPQFFEMICLFLPVVLESIDYSSLSSLVSPGPLLGKQRKHPLGNTTAVIALLLTEFQAHYVSTDDNMYQSCTPIAQKKSQVLKTAAPLELLKSLFLCLKTGSVILSSLEMFSVPLSKYFSLGQKNINLETKLESSWSVILQAVELHYGGPYDSEFLALLSPMLETALLHHRRQIKERTRRFWCATFAPVSSSSLVIPALLKDVLKKTKLTSMLDESVITVSEFGFTQQSESLEDSAMLENSVNVFVPPAVARPQTPKTARLSFVTKEAKVNGELASVKKSVDELPSDEFVKIDNQTTNTPRRRSIRRKKSYVPSLYNDLSQSQDTSLFCGSSESFDSCILEVVPEPKSQKENNTTSMNMNEGNLCAIKEEQQTPHVSEELPDAPLCSKHIADEGIKEEESVPVVINTDLDTPKTHTQNKLQKKIQPQRSSARKSKLLKTNAVEDKKEIESLPSTSLDKVINLDDSDEIIPSSQSSTESDMRLSLSVSQSVSVKSTPGPRRSLHFELETVKDTQNGLELLSNPLETTSVLHKKKQLPVVDLVESRNEVLVAASPPDMEKSIKSDSDNILPKDRLNDDETEDMTCEVLDTKAVSSDCAKKTLQFPSIASAEELPADDTVYINDSLAAEATSETATSKTETDIITEDKCTELLPTTNADESVLDMPLKSSENLQTLEEPLVKAEGKGDFCGEAIENTPPVEDLAPIQLSLHPISTEGRPGDFSMATHCVEKDLSSHDSQGTTSDVSQTRSGRKIKVTPKAAGKKAPKRKALCKSVKVKKSKISIEESMIISDGVAEHDKEPIDDLDKNAHDNSSNVEFLNLDTQPSKPFVSIMDTQNTIVLDTVPEEKDEHPKEKMDIDSTHTSLPGQDFESFHLPDTETNEVPETEDLLVCNGDVVAEGQVKSNNVLPIIHLEVEVNEIITPESPETSSKLSGSEVPLSKIQSPSYLNNKDTKTDLTVKNPNLDVSCLSPTKERFYLPDNPIDKCPLKGLTEVELDCSVLEKNEICSPDGTSHSLPDNSLTLKMSEMEHKTNHDGTQNEVDSKLIERPHGDIFTENREDTNIFSGTSVCLESSGKPVLISTDVNAESNQNAVNLITEAYNCKTESKSPACDSAIAVHDIANESHVMVNDLHETDEDLEVKSFTNELISKVTFLESHNGEHSYSAVKNKQDMRSATEQNQQQLSCPEIIVSESTECAEICVSNTDDMQVNNTCSSSSSASRRYEISSTSNKKNNKRPTRSPFNFRQRQLSHIPLITKKASKRIINSILSDFISDPSEHKENGDILPPSSLIAFSKKLPKSPKKLKSMSSELCNDSSSTSAQNYESLASSDGVENDISPRKSPSQRVLIPGIIPFQISLNGMNLEELTDLNTRLNASIAPQTRRSRQMAASRENDLEESENEDGLEATPSSPFGILKKRKLSADGTSIKMRKVTFADPLFEERLISKVGVHRAIIKRKAPLPKKKRSQTPPPEELVPVEVVASSNGSSDSRIFPLFADCHENVSVLLDNLTSSAWVHGLKTLLQIKGIQTVGDLCRLNFDELQALPLRSPKMETLHKALEVLLSNRRTNEPVQLESPEESLGHTIKSLAEELLIDDRISLLPNDVLSELSLRCISIMGNRLGKSENAPEQND